MRRSQNYSPFLLLTVFPLQGVVIFFLGALRLGWLVEFIPAPAVGGFVTGSAIQIIASQLPPLLGIKSEGGSSFEIFWNTLRNIRKARLDAALGVSGLASLSLIRWICSALTRKYPHHGPYFLSLPTLSNIFLYSPDLLLHLRHQKRVRGCSSHSHLLDNHHNFRWKGTIRRSWASTSGVQGAPHTTIRHQVDRCRIRTIACTMRRPTTLSYRDRKM